MKIAIVQLDASPSVQDNIAAAAGVIKEASLNCADIVLFPECFLSSYSFPPRTVKEDDLKPIQKVCRDCSIGAVITAFRSCNGSVMDSAFLIDEIGDIILVYDKVHTCAFSHERVLSPGRGFPVASYRGVSIGIMICYDREYPESGRALMLAGAEVILVPSDTSDMKPRNMELMVCSLQNACYTASANPPGMNKGCSVMYSPFAWEGESMVAEADPLFKGIIYGEADIEKLRKWREDEDIGKYRHPEAYRC